MNRRYWDILVQSLHNAIIEDINAIEKFTASAIEVSYVHFSFLFLPLVNGENNI